MPLKGIRALCHVNSSGICVSDALLTF